MESLAREFLLYGSVQGAAAGTIHMKCLSDVDEADRLAAETVQLKPALMSQTAAAVAGTNTGGSTLPSLCE